MKFLKTLKKRFANRPDTEHQQAFVRLAIGVFMSIYLLPGAFEDANYNLMKGMAIYLTAIASVPVWIGFDPKVNHARRLFGIVIDMASIGAAMILSGDHAIAIFVLYLWVTTGNGFRFGQKYLFIAMSFGIVSLTFTSQFSEPFIERKMLAIELMIAYMLFMGYINSLVKQLYDAIEVAQSASRAKQTFLSTMSHELRTPLHAIAGLTALLKNESAERKKALDLIGSVDTAVKHMLAIVNDILDFAKIEAGKAEIVRTEVDLDELNVSMAKMFVGQAQQKDLNFRTYFSPLLPATIASDETRLRQILSNILSNAIKFTEKGGILLSVDLVSDQHGSPCIKWSVKDTGIGIPEETIAKIFDSFTQADASTSRKYGGTGLGTTIARQFVMLLGGDIGIDSKVGKGTTFWFTIPCVTATEDKLKHPKRVTAPLLALVPESRKDVLDLCHTYHGLLHTQPEAIDREIGRETIGVAGLLVIPQGSNLPPLAHYAVTKGLKVIVLDESSTEERKREFIRLGAFSICKQASQLPRALRILQLHSGLLETEAAPPAKASVTGKRILIADDNQTNLQILSAILQMHSHIVTQANSGEDALDEFLEQDFDLFIFDMNMPDITGLELTSMMRSMGLRNSSRPVAILTADATPEAEKATREAGANLFITKPVSPEELLQKIAVLFDEKIEKTSSVQASPKQVPLVFNREALDDILRISSSPNFLATLIESYLEDSRNNMEKLLEAYEKQDFGLWRKAVHAMKGSAINLRLECLAHSLDIAHDLTPQNFNEKSRTALRHIRDEAHRAEAALRAASGSPISAN